MSVDFLFELGTEELPPTALSTLSCALTNGIETGLKEAKLGFVKIHAYATPRRLAVWVESLDASTPKESVKAWGPPAKIAFDENGEPTRAAIAFAAKNSVDVSELKTANDGKADKLVAELNVGGEEVETLLPNIVQQALSQLPIHKRMRWGSSRAEFVRPVQWIIMMINETVLPASFFEINASNVTRGHRFHADKFITISHPKNYAPLLLEQGHIVASFEERKNTIVEQVITEAKKLGGTAVISNDLLDEVTALVEWPVALGGKFDSAFLDVPSEALISSMKEHQKYFHVIDKEDALLPFFITVANIKSDDPAQVIDGNERVIRPRLADAAFFFETDKQQTLEARRARLKNVVFQTKLGSVFDKTQRVEKLVAYIAKEVGLNSTHAIRAAQLCKSDLISNMVVEFSDMQGIAGAHYALNDNEPEPVAQAIKEQYLPKYSGGALPESSAGAVLALADRIDTITGIFGIGQVPTGSKDPFALRRASLGALRLIVDKQFDLDLNALIAFAAQQFDSLPKQETVVDDVVTYMLDRFKAWYEEANIAPEIFQSVHAKNITRPLDINQRVYAVNSFYSLPQAQALAAANKRVSNILAKQTHEINTSIDTSLFENAAESTLADQVASMEKTVAPLLEKNDYAAALTTLADIRAAVDAFFVDVMVLTEDDAKRENRLALLKQLQSLFLHVADISHLAVKA